MTTANDYTMIQAAAFPNRDYDKWTIIQGKRSPAGYPIGYKGKDWHVVHEGLTYTEAKKILCALNTKR